MLWIITGIILFGLILLVLEFFMFPGTTFIGIGGVMMLGIGIALSYMNYEDPIGHYVLGGSFLAGIILFIAGYRYITSSNMALEYELEGRVNELTDIDLKAGEEGIAFTDLKPWGKIVVNGVKYEAQSISTFVERNTPIIVFKIEINKILVKPLSS